MNMPVLLMRCVHKSENIDICASMEYDISIKIKLEVVACLCPINFYQS
jgi:hypothetical protein